MVGAEDDQGDGAVFEVLLVSDSLVRGYKHLKASRFCRLDQIAIREQMPALFLRGADVMAFAVSNAVQPERFGRRERASTD